RRGASDSTVTRTFQATGETLLARILHAPTGMTGRGGVGRHLADRKRSPVKGHITLLTKKFGSRMREIRTYGLRRQEKETGRG
ncbi:MAG TPA: hypothetical protein P5321_10940, partial [Thermotogota bacterium]|nr:hypothetical protein [Thermotogota bacterium]